MKTNRVASEYLSTPHFVEWGSSDEGDASDYEEKFFAEISNAKEFAQSLAERKYSVWLGEIGTYETDRGNEIQDWIYHWSNEPSWGPNYGRGTGFPHQASSKSVSYTPYDQRGWKG